MDMIHENYTMSMPLANTGFVEYEALLEFIRSNNKLSVEEYIVEIGAFNLEYQEVKNVLICVSQ